MLTSYSVDRPITYWGKIPVYVTTIMLAGLIGGLILGTLVIVSRVPFMFALADGLQFGPEEFWKRGHVWRAFTYPFFDLPNFFSVFSLLFVFFYGRQIESIIGRSKTIIFYSLMVLGPVLFCTLAWLIGYTSGLGGGYLINISVVLAFATLQPGMEIFGGLKMKWFAWICFGLGLVQPLSGPVPDTGGLITYLLTCGLAHGYIRWLQTGGELPSLNLSRLFRPRPKMKVVRGGQSERSPERRRLSPADVFQPGASVPQAEVDRILEKVAASGISSLTATEKKLLEKHSADLKKRAGGK